MSSIQYATFPVWGNLLLEGPFFVCFSNTLSLNTLYLQNFYICLRLFGLALIFFIRYFISWPILFSRVSTETATTERVSKYRSSGRQKRFQLSMIFFLTTFNVLTTSLLKLKPLFALFFQKYQQLFGNLCKNWRLLGNFCKRNRTTTFGVCFGQLLRKFGATCGQDWSDDLQRYVSERRIRQAHYTYTSSQ